MMQSRQELNGQSIYQFVGLYAPCYAGLRTISVKLKSINNLTTFLRNIQLTTDRHERITIMTGAQLPKALKEVASDLFFIRAIGHEQELVMQRYGKIINAFRNEIAQLEVYPCDVCAQLRKKKDLQHFNPNWQALFTSTVEFKRVCQQCAPSLRKGQRPKLSVKNY